MRLRCAPAIALCAVAVGASGCPRADVCDRFVDAQAACAAAQTNEELEDVARALCEDELAELEDGQEDAFGRFVSCFESAPCHEGSAALESTLACRRDPSLGGALPDGRTGF